MIRRIVAVLVACASVVTMAIAGGAGEAASPAAAAPIGPLEAKRGVNPPKPARCDENRPVSDRPPPSCQEPRATARCDASWCSIEPGCFMMGSPWCEWGRARTATDPVEVRLTHAFKLGRHELTQREWKALGLPNPSGRMEDGTGDCLEDDCPVGNVTWFEALAFTNLLSKKRGLPACYELKQCSGDLGRGMTCKSVRTVDPSVHECRGYRLATSAEWEYAARAGTRTTVYTGDIVDRGKPPYTCYTEPVLEPIAWYCANAGKYTHPVGRKKPNPLGLHDMIGNAGEWVGTSGATHPRAGPVTDPGASLSTTDALEPLEFLAQTRGGSWNLWPHMLRAGALAADPARATGPGIGLRLAQTKPLAGRGAGR
jgi:formylglycine-generating enzyme